MGCCAATDSCRPLHLPQATRQFYTSKDEVLQLWCHETNRVIADRMWDRADKEWLRKQLDEKLSSLFSTSFNTLFEPFQAQVRAWVRYMRAPTLGWGCLLGRGRRAGLQP